MKYGIMAFVLSIQKEGGSIFAFVDRNGKQELGNMLVWRKTKAKLRYF